MISELGGKVEAFYFAFGDVDVYAILDMPDKVSVSAASLAINASGSGSIAVTVLVTPEEVDLVAKKTVNYLAPGK